MAENRGLFGGTTTSASLKSKSGRTTKKKETKIEKVDRPRKKLRDSEVNYLDKRILNDYCCNFYISPSA